MDHKRGFKSPFCIWGASRHAGRRSAHWLYRDSGTAAAVSVLSGWISNVCRYHV